MTLASLANKVRQSEGSIVRVAKEELARVVESAGPPQNSKQLSRLAEKALRLFVNEQFGAKDLDSEKDDELSAESRLVVLFQKEILLENMLGFLAGDGVDVNALLFNAFEKVQCENYCPPSGEELETKGSFRFPDALKLPASKWRKSPSLAKELRLKLESVGSTKSDEEES